MHVASLGYPPVEFLKEIQELRRAVAMAVAAVAFVTLPDHRAGNDVEDGKFSSGGLA